MTVYRYLKSDESEHEVDITPRGAFDRFVNQGKGGYCMQHGVLLLHALRALGYKL